jgi:hypothetical protein
MNDEKKNPTGLDHALDKNAPTGEPEPAMFNPDAGEDPISGSRMNEDIGLEGADETDEEDNADDQP